MIYYVAPENIEKETAVLAGDEAAHLLKVRRAGSGDRIGFTDGSGTRFDGEVIRVDKSASRAEIRILEKQVVPRPQPGLIVGFSVPKQRRIDMLLEKGTELGVDVFAPLHLERSVVELRWGSNKAERMERQMIGAAKQSERTWFPEIRPPQSLTAFIQDGAGSSVLRIFGGFGTAVRSVSEVLEDADRPVTTVCAVIGPEGGFTEDEKILLTENEFSPVSLGPHVLRIETAVMAVAAVVRQKGT